MVLNEHPHLFMTDTAIPPVCLVVCLKQSAVGRTEQRTGTKAYCSYPLGGRNIMCITGPTALRC